MTPKDLTEYRESLGLNKEQMGHVLGVSGAAVGLWEKGTNRIPMTVALLIHAQITIARLTNPVPKAPANFKNGDKALIQKLIKVIICLAAQEYRCSKCGGTVKTGKLHGVSHGSRHYCVKCCEEAK